MGRRVRSEIAWQPTEPRGARRSLFLAVIAGSGALIAYIGYMNAWTFEGPRAGLSAQPESSADETATGERPRQREARSRSRSAEPRVSPLPRQAISPQRAPLPRGELREAVVGLDH